LIWQSANRCFLNYKMPWRVYFYQRIARILPLYLLSILAVAIFASWFKGAHVPDLSMSNVLRHLTFTQDINPSVARTINPVLWSLTHEVIFYCLVPLLLMIFRHKKILTMGLFSTLGLSLLGFLLPYSMFSNFFKYSILFAVGIFIAHFGLHLKSSISAILLVSSGFITLYMVKQYDFFGYLVIAICLFNLISQNKSFQKKIFLPLAYIGIISYSVYIWHYLIIELFYPISIDYNFLDDLLIRSFSTFLIILVFSTTTYIFIERPFMHLAKNWSARHLAIRS